MAIAGNVFCTGVFKTFKCQASCIAAVEFIRDGCDECCNNGDFYNNCIKQFEDILGKMDLKICSPQWD